MSERWIIAAFVWIIAEGISYFRKKEFSQRMKTGATWSIILVSLSTFGSIDPDKASLALLASAFFLIYGSCYPNLFLQVNNI